MSGDSDLSFDERAVLRAALERPVGDAEPLISDVCLRLAARGLMQRAGGLTVLNGWQGSPRAFVLTHDGWSLLAADRRRAPIRQTG